MAKEDLKPFKKNDPRINREGRPRVLPELKEILSQILSEDITNSKGDKIQALDLIIRQLTAKATKGDLRAIQEVLDRMYGKAKQVVDMNAMMQSSSLSREEFAENLKKFENEV